MTSIGVVVLEKCLSTSKVVPIPARAISSASTVMTFAVDCPSPAKECSDEASKHRSFNLSIALAGLERFGVDGKGDDPLRTHHARAASRSIDSTSDVSCLFQGGAGDAKIAGGVRWRSLSRTGVRIGYRRVDATSTRAAEHHQSLYCRCIFRWLRGCRAGAAR